MSEIETKTYACINSSNIVENTVVFSTDQIEDTISQFVLNFPNLTLVEIVDNPQVAVGWTYSDETFIDPNPSEIIETIPNNNVVDPQTGEILNS
jgi:hypothetical protein